MKKPLVLFAAAVTVFTVSGLLQAHHSGSAYETTPIWVQGTVAGFQPSNPHTITMLEAQRGDGRVQRWLVEGPPMVRLDRAAADLYVPQVGDVIRFCAFPYKPVEELQRMWPEVDFSGRQSVRIQDTDEAVTRTVTGHIMLTPEGEKQYWEPHGVLAECIRSSDDTRRSWVGFINSGRRLVWCQQRDYAVVQQDPALTAFVEEINALLDIPCG